MNENNPLLQSELLNERRRLKAVFAKDYESIFSITIKFVVNSGLVALAIYLLFGEGVDWTNWKTYAGILLLGGLL